MDSPRLFWSALVTIVYVAAAAVRLDPQRNLSVLGAVLALGWLVGGFLLVRAPRVGRSRITEDGRRAARWAVSGAGIALAAALAPARATFVAFEQVGIGLSVVGSLLAMGRLASPESVVVRPPTRGRDDAAVAAGLLWLVAAGATVGDATGMVSVSPLVSRYGTVAAALGSMAVTLVATLRLYALRRYELGVAERAAAALWFTLLGLVAGLFATLMGVGKPEDVVPRAALIGALAVTGSAIGDDAARVSRLLRRVAAATLLGAPVASAAVFLAYKEPTHAGLVLFVATVLATTMGLIAPHLADWLAPERGLWVRVLRGAVEAAQKADPREAVIAVLSQVRRHLHPEARAMLYRLSSGDRAIVDRAGYLHLEPAEVPMALVDLVTDEPYRVLATDALRAAEVRSPGVRELIAWLDLESAGFVALVFDDDVCVGMLLWPHAGRTAPLSLEEVELARLLADHLGLVTGAAAELARSRQRELQAEAARAETEAEVALLREAMARGEERQRGLAEVLARSLQNTSYSPTTAAARIDVEIAAKEGETVCLVAAPGIDALAWAAVAHLASPRRDGPLVWIDGSHSPEQPLSRWEGEASPLLAARGGSLVIFEPHALAPDTQEMLGQVGFGGLTAVLVLPEPAPPGLHPRLSARLGDAFVTIPPLAERPEDLRALALHELARLGHHRRGRPYGLDLEAQELLFEHDWPGNDIELLAVLLKATQDLSGDVVDVRRLSAALGDGVRRRSGPVVVGR